MILGFYGPSGMARAGMGENLYKDEKIFKNLNSLQNQSGKIF